MAEPVAPAPRERCGKCNACRLVESTKSLVLVMARPAGPGIQDSDVRMWNKILEDNPCERWSHDS